MPASICRQHELLASLWARSNSSHIVVFDNLHRACIPGQFAAGVEFREADIRDQTAVENAMNGCQIVFHLAAQSNVMSAVADADLSVR